MQISRVHPGKHIAAQIDGSVASAHNVAGPVIHDMA
jgi:hypothetical protein